MDKSIKNNIDKLHLIHMIKNQYFKIYCASIFQDTKHQLNFKIFFIYLSLQSYNIKHFYFNLGFKINSHNIKSHIESTAKEIIEEITNTVKNQLISLKLDCVKRHNRCIMGVNVQFINEGQLQLKTLAMVEINEQNTSENLKTAVMSINLLFIS